MSYTGKVKKTELQKSTSQFQNVSEDLVQSFAVRVDLFWAVYQDVDTLFNCNR